MAKPYHIIEGQFYITNACNLTCDRCITYNNRKFKGHFYWKDQQAHHKEWSTKLDIESITIIGGEPFANPDLINWVNGLSELWPECADRSVCTNGTYLSRELELAKEIVRKGFWLDLCVHDPAHYDEIQNALTEIITSCFGKQSVIVPQSNINQKEFFINGRRVAKLSKMYNFASMATKSVSNKITYMHNSDPKLAHENCGARYCHYFVRGNLYKCFLTAVSDDLIDQFVVEPRAVEMLKNYKSCSPWDDNISQFMEDMRHPIEQCRLCPEKSNIRPIWPLAIKKIDI
jgi:hypothetical protein